MKVESRTIIGASVFLGAVCILYWVLVEYHGASAERAGITMLLFSFAAYGMLGAYLLLQYFRRKRIPRPEDSFDATQSDGAGLVGYFPSASIWPVAVGLGMIFGGMALVWGVWYFYIGAVLFVGAAIGWVVESDYSEDVETGSPVESIDQQH
jgi:cytochrome c oxidase subunit IV